MQHVHVLIYSEVMRYGLAKSRLSHGKRDWKRPAWARVHVRLAGVNRKKHPKNTVDGSEIPNNHLRRC